MNGFKVRCPAVGRRLNRASGGTRTLISRSEGLRSTIELHPHEAVSGSRTRAKSLGSFQAASTS
jgi:hypothetical protein